MLEVLHRFFDAHVEHVSYRLPLVLHLKGLPVVPGALAFLAFDIDISEEVHLDLDEAVSFAGIATSSPDVEGEPARLVAPHLCFLGPGKDRTDLIEDFCIGRRVGPRGLPDRRLVDDDDLVDLGVEDDLVVLPGLVTGLVDDLHHALVERLVHEGRLPAARDAGDDREEPDGELRGDVLEVILPAALDRDVPFGCPAFLRHIDHFDTGEVLTGQGFFILLDLLWGTLRDNIPAVHPGTRTHIDDMLGRPDHILVMLHDEYGIAEVAERPQGLDELPVVTLVKADGGFIEDIEDTHQVRADLGGEPDPLGFAAGERPGVPREREVPEPDFFEEVEPGLDLLDDLDGDLFFLWSELQVPEQGSTPPDRQVGDIDDGLSVDPDCEHLVLEPLPFAGRAVGDPHVALELPFPPV